MDNIRALHYLSASSILKYLGTPVDALIQEHSNHKNIPEFHSSSI